MDWAEFLPLALVEALEPLAKARGVSEVARGPGGFLEAFRAAGGDPERLPKHWRVKRQAFLRRHVAQGRKEGWWEDAGDEFPDNETPTRRHLALVMWAWSPDDLELDGWASEWKARRARRGRER